MLRRIIDTDDSKTTIIIRLMVGIVFLSEGIKKFLFPYIIGAGRFAKNRAFLGTLVGSFEIICGTLLLVGLLTQIPILPLIIIMLVAIFTTKMETLTNDGLWVMMHTSRTDCSMLLGSIFLLIRGVSKYSIDHQL